MLTKIREEEKKQRSRYDFLDLQRQAISTSLKQDKHLETHTKALEFRLSIIEMELEMLFSEILGLVLTRTVLVNSEQEPAPGEQTH